MAEDPKRPALRIVSPDEIPSGPGVEPQASAEAAALRKSAAEVDGTKPLGAAFLACVGCRLADAALQFHHQAVAHAPPDTFRRDTPPGMKSAEATRAWLSSHLDEVRQMAAPDGAVKPYARWRDLRDAVSMAADELDHATAVTKVAGLWFDERRQNLFAEAEEDLRAVRGYIEQPKRVTAVDAHPADEDLYLFGADVLGGILHVA